jgi:hypothetical protein
MCVCVCTVYSYIYSSIIRLIRLWIERREQKFNDAHSTHTHTQRSGLGILWLQVNVTLSYLFIHLKKKNNISANGEIKMTSWIPFWKWYRSRSYLFHQMKTCAAMIFGLFTLIKPSIILKYIRCYPSSCIRILFVCVSHHLGNTWNHSPTVSTWWIYIQGFLFLHPSLYREFQTHGWILAPPPSVGIVIMLCVPSLS